MSRRRGSVSRVFAVGLPLLATWTTACNYGPSRIEPPSINASSAAAEAIELYDANGDGFIAGDELNKAPGLKAAMETLDSDKDGKVNESEIAARIRAWQDSRIGVAGIMCIVKLDGQPLEGATIEFEPEPFLAGAIQAGIGGTDFTGVAYPRIPKEKRPVPDMPGGMQLGLYRVKISKMVNGKETIPAMYNTETVLGQQIAPDDPVIKSQRITLELKSR